MTDKRLRADFTWVLSGNVLYSACQWGIVVVLAKLGSPAQLGEYALGLAVAAPIILFANLQLRALLACGINGAATVCIRPTASYSYVVVAPVAGSVMVCTRPAPVGAVSG